MHLLTQISFDQGNAMNKGNARARPVVYTNGYKLHTVFDIHFGGMCRQITNHQYIVHDEMKRSAVKTCKQLVPDSYSSLMLI